MARKRNRRADSDAPYELVDENDRESGESSSRQRPRRRSRLSRWFTLLIVLVALVAALPTIIARTPLRDHALRWAGNSVSLQVKADAVGGGWLTPLSASNLVVNDSQGQTLLEVAHARLERSLIELIQDRNNLGSLRLEKPIAHVSVREDGSNWQDALAPMLQGESHGETPRLHVEVEEGVIHLQDSRRLRNWEVSPLKLTASLDASKEIPLMAQLSTQLTDDQGQTGRVNLTLEAADIQFHRVRADVDTQRMPLAMLQPLLTGAGLQLSGDADLRSQIQFVNAADPRVQLTIQSMDVRQFSAASPLLPEGDAIQLHQLTGVGEVRWENGHLLADNLQLQSDVASVTANGRLELEHLLNRALTDDDQVELAAQVDLARLAAILPRTLHIKPGTHIDSGAIQATLSSRTEAGQRVWHAVVNASDLAATSDNQQVRWNQPVSVVVDASQQNGQWLVRKLSCLSSFLQVTGGGKANAGQLSIAGDLDQLRRELSQFVQLGGAQMAGTAKGELRWQQTTAGLDAEGDVNLNNFQLALPNKAPLVEKQLELKFQARGQVAPSGALQQIDNVQLTLAAAGDYLKASLRQPVIIHAAANYPVQLQMSGELSRWVMRAAVLSGLPQLEGDGQIDFEGDLAVSSQKISIGRSQLTAAPCKIQGLGLPIDEPQLTAAIIGVYDIPAGRWQGGDSQIVSSTFAARCDNLVVQPGSITGDVACRGNLERMLRMLHAESAELRYQGEFSGVVRLAAHQGQRIQFDIQQRLENFAVLSQDTSRLQTVSNASPWRTSWSEPFIDLNAVGVYEPAAGQANFDQLKLGLDSAKLDVRGAMSDLQGRVHADLTGKLSYDLQRLTKKLQPITGNSIQLEGLSDRDIAIRGPLLSPPLDPAQVAAGEAPLLPVDLTAQAGFSWDSALIEGFRIGGGQINTSLEQATVRFDGMQIPVSQGKILLAPQVSFRTASPVLTVPAGPVIENLKISQEMTTTWMKYVAPMLADATRIDGSFSASVQQMNVPLTNPRAGTMQGSLTIHTAKAGPGPLAQQLLQLVHNADNLVRGVGEGGQLNFDRALELLQNGPMLNQQGRFDPQRALSALTGATNAPNANAANVNGGATANANAVWLSVPEHAVKYHVANDRVHHEGMRVLVDDVEVRTTGSVGFDETLNLVAELPIPDKWIGSNPRLASLKGQVIRVPVAGTVRRPRIDKMAFQQLTQQLLSSAYSGLIPGNLFGQGPAGQGGVPNMTPTGAALAPNGQPPAEGQPVNGQPNSGQPNSQPNSQPNELQQKIDGAAGNVQREVDRAFKKFGNLFKQ